jgi:methionyl-tRNA formyltransferase
MARLAFFGTPSFSLPCLSALEKWCRLNGHKLLMIVTQKDQPQGRGQALLPSPVKEFALRHGIAVRQPASLKKGSLDGDEFFREFSLLDLDLAVVVAYGKIITERLLSLPRRGFLNIHASILPRFRGAAPIQRAIQAGDKQTGVCLMDMVKALDEGDVFRCQTTPIIASDTSSTLFRRLAHCGAHLLVSHLDDLLAGRLAKTPQASSGVSYASMLDKSEGLLNFNKSGLELSLEARAFDPWPATFGFLHNKRVKFFASFFIEAPAAHPSTIPGTIVVAGDFLGIKTKDGLLFFQAIQVEGKKILPIKEALKGFAITKGDRILSKPS